jgi:hypothetical protein
MRRMSFALLAALVAVSLPAPGRAADQTVLGKVFVVKNPGPLEKRKIVVKAIEQASDDTLVGDPTVNGATLTVRVEGTSPSSQSWYLPTGTSATGKSFWSGSATKGYKYVDSLGQNGPVKVAQLKRTGAGVFKMKAVVLGKLGTISVLPPADGTLGCALLAVYGGDSYSVRFGDGVVANKGDKVFKVAQPATEGTCDLCGNGVVDPGEQCDGSACGAFGGACQADCTCTCDFLDGSECLYPFPSDYLTVPDPLTDTGRRVHFSVDAMPENSSAVPIDPTAYHDNDGFSQGATMLLHVPGVDLGMTGAAPITDIERSLDADAPVVVVNASTLEHQLMFVELDANATTEPDTAMIIHPAKNLDEGTRYIVALRNMKDASGTIIPPSTIFQDYRDDIPTGDPVIEARRPHMEELFATLEAAGVPRDDLYLAWDFTVASERNITERLLFMRDDAFARLGGNAPAFTVTQVDDDVDSNVFRRVRGTFQVDRYVDSTTAPARLVLDAHGLPVHQDTPQPADFLCVIPRAALADAGATAVPARPAIYGHGLLGSEDEVSCGTGNNVCLMANEHNFVFCATKLIGMSSMDIGNALSILLDLSKFPSFPDRQQQGILDYLYLARLMTDPQGFISDPAFQDGSGNPVIDPSAVFYDGNSQGGIFGGTVMAVAQDITRGVLGVPGMNYSLLLTRSTDFATYSAFLYPAYPNELQRPLLLGLMQMLWDRSDPDGYARHIKNDPLPNTPSHDVLLHLAFGDHQVANVSTEIEARTIGASIHQPAINPGRNPDVTPYVDIPAIPSYPFDGSALVVWDSGADPAPIENIAPSTGPDPHSDPRKDPTARQQKSDFLQTGGMVTDVCSGAPCTIP